MSKNQSILFLEKLIAFDTTSYLSNLNLIDYLKQIFEQHDIFYHIDYNEAHNKANLFASVGPRDVAGILLSGHSDVVPVQGQEWQSPPFQAMEKNNHIYGRGSADMKGFLACALNALIEASKVQLKKPLHLCISYDEEIGCIGVRSILTQLNSLIVTPLVCVIGEPTMMQIALAHKGKTVYRAICHGQEGHSALAPRYTNAIYVASHLLNAIQQTQQNLAAHGEQDQGYDIPYTTVHVGKIQGGVALNIVPNQCCVDYEIRHLAQDSSEQIQQQIIDQLLIQHGEHITIDEVNQYPGLKTSPTIDAVKFIQSLVPENTKLNYISFGTEGGLFQKSLHCPVIVCGPGDIEVAHKPNEYVALEQLQQCDHFLKNIIKSLQ